MIKIRYVIADGNSFEAITQRIHHLSDRLSDDNYVLYIEEPGNLISVFLSPEKPLSNLWKWIRGIRLEKSRTYVFTPPPLIPFGYISPTINSFNHWVQGLILKSSMKKLDISDSMVIVPNVLGKGWRYWFKNNPLVYDCCDEITEFKIPSMRKNIVKREEIELMHDSNYVVVSSQLLYEKKRIHSKNIDIIRNGCEYEFFSRADEMRFDDPPSDLLSIKKQGPIIGFFGNISTWFDTEMVAAILNSRPAWQFVFIGPTFINTDRFKSFPNCHFLGKKQYKEIPEYLAHFECGIIPFLQNELTKYVNPVKAYEYLAGGVGVVATPLDEYNYFDNLVYQADNVTDFIKGIEEMMSQNYREAKQKRMEFAKDNDWRSRLDAYIEIIKKAEEEHSELIMQKTYTTPNEA